MRICIFKSFANPIILEPYKQNIQILNDGSGKDNSNYDTCSHIFRSNIKIMYDRNSKKERETAYEIMRDLIKTNKVELVTDTLYMNVKVKKKDKEDKGDKGEKGGGEEQHTIKPILPRDRIILRYKEDAGENVGEEPSKDAVDDLEQQVWEEPSKDAVDDDKAL